MTQPSVNCFVHYVARGSADCVFPSACRAAIVTEVGISENPGDPVVGLCVINPTGLFFHPIDAGGVTYSDSHEPGTWHWPERV